MNRTEVTTLLTKASAIDGRPVTNDVVEAWYMLLKPLDFEQAMAAMMNHFATDTYRLMPAHIVQGVKKLREEGMAEIQAAGQSAQVPDADPDDVRGYLVAVREQRMRMGDQVLPGRPVQAMIENLGERLAKPSRHPMREPTPLVVACPNAVCRKPIGYPCRSAGGRQRAPHPERVALFEEWKAAKRD